jgi:peptidoglycan-N-acetylglucosamine deacetylase
VTRLARLLAPSSSPYPRGAKDRSFAKSLNSFGLSIFIFLHYGYNDIMVKFRRLQIGMILMLMGTVWCGRAPGLAWGAEDVTVWAGAPQEKAVALTFDDGPSPIYTPKILALLKQYNACGTFFVIGHKVEQTPWLVEAELKGGNEVGNHSFSHPRMPNEDQLSRERELERTGLDLDLAGCPRDCRLFRPPYSACDDRLKSYMAHTGRRLVMWSLDSGDWQGLSTPAIVRNVLSRVKNGAIIIFHDSDEKSQADRQPTVEALKIILPALQAQGYRMVTVSELISLKASRRPPATHGN